MSQTALVSIVIESLFFGIFTVLFLYSQSVLITVQRERGYNKFLWGACVVMFILALIHFVIDAVRVNMAFIGLPNGFAGSEAFLTDLSNPTFVFKSTVYEAQTILGDACIIYRTYLVWGNNKLIILLPGLLFLANTVSAAVLIEQFATLPVSSTIFVLTPWGVGYLFASLATNIICTFSIAWRIWRHALKTSYYGAVKTNTLKPAMVVVIESGALYSAALVAVVAAFMSSSWGHFIVLDSLSSIIGITFTAIIIWLHMLERQRAGTIPTVHNSFAHPERRISTVHTHASRPYSSHVVNMKKTEELSSDVISDKASIETREPYTYPSGAARVEGGHVHPYPGAPKAFEAKNINDRHENIAISHPFSGGQLQNARPDYTSEW